MPGFIYVIVISQQEHDILVITYIHESEAKPRMSVNNKDISYDYCGVTGLFPT